MTPDRLGLRALNRATLARQLLLGRATLLVDGLWQADWKITRQTERAVLEIRPFIRLDAADRDAIAAEGERLLGFAVPAKAVRDVRFAPVRSG